MKKTFVCVPCAYYIVCCKNDKANGHNKGRSEQTDQCAHTVDRRAARTQTHALKSKYMSVLITWKMYLMSHNLAKCPDSFLTSRNKWMRRLSVFIILFSCLRLTQAHPQCLDYQPPFKPFYHLEFCNQYGNFGCCDQQMDNRIGMRYWDIMDLIGDEAYEACADLVKDIMCQVMSDLLSTNVYLII